jgi:hypothetical protein
MDQDIGVAFPGEGRSSTDLGRRVFADAARVIDPGLAREIDDADWYDGYVELSRRLEQAEADDAAGAAAVPGAGLASLHERIVWAEQGLDRPLQAALDDHDAATPSTVTVDGTGVRDTTARVPYRGTELTGDALRRQADAWVTQGVVEPSAAAALHRVLDEPAWLDCSDLTMVVFGGASEMGPLEQLARWGATTLVVDLPGGRTGGTIERLLRAGSGRGLLPSDGPADDVAAAGIDLLRGAPRVAAWLDEHVDGPVVLGNYVYAHGATNVLVSAAVDALTARLLAAHPDAAVAGLATPTDVYAVPAAAVAASRAGFAEASAVRRVAGRIAASAAGGALLAPNFPDDATGAGVVDCQIPQQGCNYALAKRIHRWRAHAARADGHRVSMNVAPATRTRSVTDRRLLAAAYGGAHRYGVEVFDPATSRALMALLLVHDLRANGVSSDPTSTLDHPLDLLADQACHSGLWRIPWAPRTVLPLAAARGLARPATWRR